ncbi:MAG: truB [Acidimicrobiaceae bacterium]|nr:truB [Acidimicrobiaceae bacterium]
MTSHDVVARARHLLAQPKAGHAGTLDPDATGVLVVGLGRATRLLRFATGLAKSYAGEIVLGTTTSTLDSAGDVTATFEMSGITPAEVSAAAGRLTGRILQVPPMVSAVKVGGRRLHEIAREGGEIEREARPVEVSRFDVEPTSTPGVYRAEVECSSGTYVRVLAADLGALLGGGAHLRALRRHAVGQFLARDAVELDELARSDVRSPSGLVAHLPQLVVGEELLAPVGYGKVLDRRALGATGDGPWAITDGSGALLAVYEPWDDDRAKPMVVLTGAPGPDGPPGAGDGGVAGPAGGPAPLG